MRMIKRLNGVMHAMMRSYVVRQYTKKLAQIRRAAPEKLARRDSAYEKVYAEYWHRLLPNANPAWGSLYVAMSGEKDVRYVPEDVFYGVIERCFNFCDGAKGYVENKCDVTFYIPEEYRPRQCLAYNRGVFFNGKMEAISPEEADSILKGIEEDTIGKPAFGTSGGVGVKCFRPRELTREFIEKTYEGFVLQERIRQEGTIAKFNPSSLNTCRMMTFRRPWSGKISVIAAMLRLGGDDSPVDNVTSGGVCVDIDSDGNLAKTAYDYRFRSYLKHPKTGVVFEGQSIPGYAKMVAAVTEVARRIPGFNLLGFDVAIDSSGKPKIIEINATSISMKVQTRRPLFGEETEQVIAWCKAHRKFDTFTHFRTWY